VENYGEPLLWNNEYLLSLSLSLYCHAAFRGFEIQKAVMFVAGRVHKKGVIWV
jgi:hypothetical protein